MVFFCFYDNILKGFNEISKIYQGLTSDERSIVKKYTYYKNAVDKIKGQKRTITTL